MSSLAVTTGERVRKVEVTEDTLTVALINGRCTSVPLGWYPRRLHADDVQRRIQSWTSYALPQVPLWPLPLGSR
jgi:hypothetical protein